MKNWSWFVKGITAYWPRSVDLLSSAIILLVRSAKVIVGLAFRSYLTCTALEDSLASFLNRTCLSSSEISLSLLSSKDIRLCMDTSDTNSTAMQESMLNIAMKYTKRRNRSEVKHFLGFRCLLISSSIWVSEFKILPVRYQTECQLLNPTEGRLRLLGKWTFCADYRYIARNITIDITIHVTCRVALTSLIP